MADSIEKVTFENAADELKGKIRNAFVELLSEEQWKGMVEKELKAFFNERWEKSAYGSSRKVASLFSELCKSEVTSLFQNRIKEELQVHTTYRGDSISELVKEWLTENSEELLKRLVKSMFESSAQNAINAMGHQQ